MKRALWGMFAIALASGCARFHDEPLSAAETLAAFESRTLDNAELRAFVQAHMPAADWPPKSWDLRSLTLAALYYHPDLAEARAGLAVARSGIVKAGERPNPAVSLAPQFNSTTPSDAPISQWVLGLDLDVPIETAGKRGHRIAQARHLLEAARLKIAATAWQVRSRVRRSLLDLYAATRTVALLKEQQAIQEETVRLLKLRLDAGAVSPFEVSQASIGLSTTRLSLEDAVKKQAEARVELADALAVPVEALDSINLSFTDIETVTPDLPEPDARRQALLNRPDILGSLAEYEASQAALQLEIAKQYPDVHLGPGYEYDQSEHKWGVGLSVELPVLNQNQGAIAEAEARRAEAAARFNTLQARVIGEIDKALAGYRMALQKIKTAASLTEELKKREEAARAMFEAGEILKLTVTATQLQLSTHRLDRLNALIEAQQSLGLLEDAMQSPAVFSDWPSIVASEGDGARGDRGVEEKHRE